MAYDMYKPDVLYPMFFNTFHIRPYATYDNCFTVYEQIGAALQHVNDVIKETNDMGSALVKFEQYVLDSLTQYDSKIISEITTKLTGYINDGTIANLINNLIFGQINTDIANLGTRITNETSRVDGKFTQVDSYINTINDKIDLINYKPPTSSITISPSKTLYKRGDTVNGILINVNMVKNSKDIVEVKYYKNDVLINTKTLQPNTLSDSFIDATTITTNQKYYVTVSDGVTTVKSNEIYVYFSDLYYYGILPVAPNTTNVLTLTTDLSEGLNKEYTFSPNLEYIVMGYPSIYGNLTSIKNENEELIDSFLMVQLVLSGNNYNFYYSPSPVKVNNHKIKFEF